MKELNPNRYGKREGGFSLTELVVAVAVALVLMGIGMPSFLRAYHTYQLSNAATQVAGILRFTRYEGIRRNTPISCQAQPSIADPTMTTVWADSNKNNLPDATEQQILLGNGGNLVDPGGVPGVPALIAAAQVSSAWQGVPPNGTLISFDARGAAVTANGLPLAKVSVFCLASPAAPEAGYRAILLTPAGSIQVWSGDTSGNWWQMR
jgi:prepilin-type N-terminal cleavage/methylation domain-containing protein